MKMTEELKKAAHNMAPGIITAEGFLGQDERDLATIIQQDEEAMRKLGLDWTEVAEKLRAIIRQGEDGLGEAVLVGSRWLVKTDDTRGTLPSPWEDGVFHKMAVEIELAPAGRGTGDKLLLNELCLHLLEKHHFLQGRGSLFRLEPAMIQKVLFT